MKISILACGSWATAVGQVLADDNEVLLYSRKKEDLVNINIDHINKRYFPKIKLSKNISLTNDLDQIAENDIIINALPSQKTREVLYKIKDKLTSDKILINLSKGLEIKTHKRISEIVKEISKDVNYAVLSGPSHAEEVIEKMPTALVCAAEDIKLAQYLQELFTRDYFRVYSLNDVVGVELGGAIKNVLAFGIGMATGLKFGDNTKAALITRGIHEMNRFAVNFGANPKTISGLAGIGDLIVTATSMHSRNNRAGILVGQGFSVDEAVKKVKTVVEGIPSTKAIYEKAREENIELPITNEIYKVVFENFNPQKSVMNLMRRANKNEY